MVGPYKKTVCFPLLEVKEDTDYDGDDEEDDEEAEDDVEFGLLNSRQVSLKESISTVNESPYKNIYQQSTSQPNRKYFNSQQVTLKEYISIVNKSP